ncbi:hypothetical protein F5Y18DRAFT_130054 [Xylariaceae sp. FL1019]|nr:hypothetical protein F5Y18DRAFT_130054 [Xylariaceae sp. FL1019]
MIIRTPFPILVALATTICAPSEAVAITHPDAAFTSTASIRKRSGLSQGAKNGISVAVTLAFILLVGSIATYCVIRRRRKVLQRPARAPAAIAADEGIHFEPTYLVKGKQNAPFTNSPSVGGQPTAQGEQHAIQQAANHCTYPSQEPAYPTIPQPQPAYIPQQSTHTFSHSSTTPVYDYSYNGTTQTVPSPTNDGFAGPSYSQSYSYYQPATQPSQYQHANGTGWAQAESTLPAPIEEGKPRSHDFQYSYQSPDQTAYQTQGHTLNRSHSQQSQHSAAPVSATMTSFDDISSSNMYLIPEHIPQPTGEGEGDDRTYQAGFDGYHVPPPHAHASELPEQRKPVELMGEGHYRHYKELH